jgi:hypothetical protein
LSADAIAHLLSLIYQRKLHKGKTTVLTGINWNQMSHSEGHSMLMSRLPYFAAGLVKPEMYLAICFSLQSVRQMDKLYAMLVTVYKRVP